MGSGDKFYIEKTSGFGLGLFIKRWPHQLSLTITIANLMIYIGFGKGYDE